MLYHMYLGTCWILNHEQRCPENSKYFITRIDYFLFCITFTVAFENVIISVLSILSVSQPHYYL